MHAPRCPANVAWKYSRTAARHQQAVTRRDSVRITNSRIGGAVVEVAIAVVVEAGGDVEGAATVQVILRGEVDFARQVQRGIAEHLVDGVIGAVRDLSRVGVAALRREGDVVVGGAAQAQVHIAKKDGKRFQRVLLHGEELDVTLELAAVLRL